MKEKNNVYDFPFGRVVHNDWYFYVIPKEEAEFDVENIKLLIEVCMKLRENRKYCVMVDANKHVKATSEGREWAAKAGYNDYIVARAVITNSLAMKMTANFFIRFNKPVVETRLFTSTDEAKDWMQKKFLQATY